MQADQRISAPARDAIRQAILDAKGGEVVFAGHLGADGLVGHVDVVAQGTDNLAPAPVEVLKKGAVVIHNHPTGVLRPSEADVYVAADLATSGVGSFIVDNDVNELTVVCEPAEPRTIAPLNSEDLASVLDDGGPLARSLDSFEPRSTQIEMLKAVAAAFNESRLLAVEAGTGVGKSYAYLIPVLSWAAQNDERVVISTATINLQQQLIDRDIPTILRLLDLDVPAVLVKGRGNYLCRKRLGEALSEASLFEEPNDELLRIREWAGSSATGSLSDVPFVPADAVWSQVNSDADSCTELSCRLRDDCFFLHARREAAGARVLVANHHLLFIDLSLRIRGVGFDTRAVLPPFQRLVFDEAHNIENSATSLFSDSFSVHSVQKHVRRLHRRRKGKVSGLVPAVRRLGADEELVRKTVSASVDATAAADQLNDAVVQLSGEPAIRLTPSISDELRLAVIDNIATLQSAIVRLSAFVADLVEGGEEGEGGPYHDLRVTARRVDRLAALCRSFVEFETKPDRVFWIELRRSASGNQFARFISTPLDIRDIMREAVFEAFETVVFTSATLTVAGRFNFWASRIGLEDNPREPTILSLPSPFPYAHNALLAVPTDAPEPSSEEYEPYLSDFLRRLLELSEGHALVLFTSYQMLNRAFDAVRDHLISLGISTLRQGQDDRARLLARFNDDPTSVLFATESFWQGVDAPGDALKVVVVCRLPFRVPTDPVLTARTELIETRGGNAFADLALPEAVMKLRQGFGRLIRRSTDRGVVVITDVRLLTRPYGQLFLESLPQTGRSTRSTTGVLDDIERFLYP